MTTTLILNNGVEIPAIGFGVFQTPPDETTAAVETAPAASGTDTSTPPPPMATSAVSVTPSVAAASIATTCSSRPRCGSATTATTSRACGTRSRSSGRPMWAAGTGHHNRLTGTHRAAETNLMSTTRAQVERSKALGDQVWPVSHIERLPSESRRALQADSEHGFIDASLWSRSGRPGWRGDHCCPVDQRPRFGGGCARPSRLRSITERGSSD